MSGSGDIASAARTGAETRRRCYHGANHLRVLSHAEIVVRAPDHDLARPGWRMPNRVRETAGNALEIGKNSVTLLFSQPVQRRSKERVVIHALASDWRLRYSPGRCDKL